MAETLRLTADQAAALRLDFGLGAEGLALHLRPGAVPLDQNPHLADLCALRVDMLGHEDVIPRAWDWDNLLSFLEPQEELLWIVDFRQAARDGAAAVQAHLALKFTGGRLERAAVPAERRKRFQALASQFGRQAFPESQVQALAPAATWSLVQGLSGAPDARTVCVAGMPSPRAYADDAVQVERGTETRAWQSLNDVVETCLGLDTSFRLVFAVSRLGTQALNTEYARVTSLRDALHPLVQRQVQSTEMNATTQSEQTGSNQQEGGSQRQGDYPFAETVRRWLNLGRWALDRDAQHDTRPTHTWGLSTTSNHTQGTTHTRLEGLSQEQLRSDLLMADEALDRYTRSLYDARGTGAFRAAVLVTANGSSTDVIAGAVRGVLAGARSKDHPLACFEIEGEAGSLLRTTRPTLELLSPALPVLQLDQACHLLLLPEAELPGLPMQRSVFLGRNASPPQGGSGSLVSLGHDAFLDGRSGRDQREVEIPAEDLFRHVVVAGTTGSGKTRRVLKILQALEVLGDDLRVIVFETAKRTYREEFQRLPGPSPRIYTMGDATEYPLRINPFYFEPGTALKRHVSVLADALAELMPTEAMIGPYIRQAVEEAYLHAGWDIESGLPADGVQARIPTVIEFVHRVRKIADGLHYGAEVGANYRGALDARARLFLDATFQDIFSGGGTVPVDQLFDRDTIIELEALPPSEIDVPAFLLSMVLERLRARQARSLQQGQRPRGWLVVIEEAHNVLSREGEGRRDSGESNAGRTLLTRVVRLLQEGRELRVGVMVVDQAPGMLARGVLKNANTKIAMRLEDHEEMREMGQSLALGEERWRDLGLLRQGEAIVKATYMRQPVKSAPFDTAELPAKVDPGRRDPVAGRTPAYRTLEASWAAVLAGQGPRPGPDWLAAMSAAAVDDGELLRFGLGRALLREHPTGSHLARTAAALLEDFGGLPTDPDGLLRLAQRHHARARSVAAARQLWPLERRVFAAEVGAAWQAEWSPVSPLGLRTAASALAKGAEGPVHEKWMEALLRLALSGATDWDQACGYYLETRDTLGAGPLHTPVRLRCIWARLSDHPLVAAVAAPRPDPLRVRLLARALVDDVACAGPRGADLHGLAGQVGEILRRSQGGE